MLAGWSQREYRVWRECREGAERHSHARTTDWCSAATRRDTVKGRPTSATRNRISITNSEVEATA